MKKTVAENLNLPAALMSRFDLLFVLLDVPNLDADLSLARHVAHVHQHGAPPALDFTPVSTEVLRAYVAMARTVEPHVPRELGGARGVLQSMRQGAKVPGAAAIGRVHPVVDGVPGVVRERVARVELGGRAIGASTE